MVKRFWRVRKLSGDWRNMTEKGLPGFGSGETAYFSVLVFIVLSNSVITINGIF